MWGRFRTYSSSALNQWMSWWIPPRSPPCLVQFHTGKKSSEPKSIDLRAVGPLLAKDHVAFAGGNRRVCFLSGCFTSFNRNQQNLGLLRIIWATFQAKMIQQNGTFESTSGQRLTNSVWLRVMQKRCAAFSLKLHTFHLCHEVHALRFWGNYWFHFWSFILHSGAPRSQGELQAHVRFAHHATTAVAKVRSWREQRFNLRLLCR